MVCVFCWNSGTKRGVQGSEAGQCFSRRPQQGRKLASASDSVSLCLSTAAASTVPHTRCGLSASLDSDLNHHYFSFAQCSEPHTHTCNLLPCSPKADPPQSHGKPGQAQSVFNDRGRPTGNQVHRKP